jgi:hypothetical protein
VIAPDGARVLHACYGQDQLWIVGSHLIHRGSDTGRGPLCTACHAPLLPGQLPRVGHAFMECDRCEAFVGLCAQEALNAFVADLVDLVAGRMPTGAVERS